MRRIDTETWRSRRHFRLYSRWDHPRFSLCASAGLTEFYPVVKHRGVSFTVATIYLLARAANAIPEFRYRTRTGEVMEHSIVHPPTTVVTDEALFSLYTIDCVEDFSLFAERAAEQITDLQQHPTLKDGPGRDDLSHMTAIPWVSSTSFMHPLDHPVDPGPRFAWGRLCQDGESRKMPLGVQAHHALTNGVHEVQDVLRHPGRVLGQG